MSHQIIFEGGSQTLSTVPVNRHGRPTPATAATYRIVDLRRAEEDPTRLVSSGVATLDSTTTATTAACGLGTSRAKEALVTSEVGFVQGRHYLLINSAGLRELVLCDGVAAGVVKFRNEVARKFDAGSTLRGIEVSCVFPGTEAAREESLQNEGGPYAIDWTWDVDPSPQRDIAFIVRQTDSLVITEEELLAIDPTLSAATGNRLSLATAIRTAAAEVRAKMKASGVDPNNFHGAESAVFAVAYRAAWHIFKHKDGEANAEKAKEAKEESQTFLDNLLVGRPPEGSVKTEHVGDTAPAGTTRRVNHWQRIA